MLWSWQIILRSSNLIPLGPADFLSAAMTYQCVMIVGAALGAFLPTLVADVGYTGAIAQVYTLPPYGAAAVVRQFLLSLIGLKLVGSVCSLSAGHPTGSGNVGHL